MWNGPDGVVYVTLHKPSRPSTDELLSANI